MRSFALLLPRSITLLSELQPRVKLWILQLRARGATDPTCSLSCSSWSTFHEFSINILAGVAWRILEHRHQALWDIDFLLVAKNLGWTGVDTRRRGGRARRRDLQSRKETKRWGCRGEEELRERHTNSPSAGFNQQSTKVYWRSSKNRVELYGFYLCVWINKSDFITYLNQMTVCGAKL